MMFGTGFPQPRRLPGPLAPNGADDPQFGMAPSQPPTGGMMFRGFGQTSYQTPPYVGEPQQDQPAPSFRPDMINPDLTNSTVAKPGFFSKRGGWLDVLGGVADAFAGQPIYQTAQRDRRQREFELEEIRSREAIQQANRQQDRQWQQDNWLQQQQWKQEHPDDQFTQYLTAAGIDPRSTEGQQLYRQRAETMATPPTVAVDGWDAEGNQTKTFMPRAGIGGGQSAGPPVGTIRKGFRFTGGNYKDQNSWVPVGGAPSAGGATFP